MKLRYLTILAMLFATTMLLAQATNLFFSEYVEGTSNNKALEIYNGTGATVDLTQYSVKLGSNGNAWGTTLALTGTLANDDVFIIANAGANAAIQAVADVTSTVTYYNGNDAVGLFQGANLIDTIGQELENPGIAWAVAGVTDAMLNHTLIRKPTVISPTTNWPASAGTSAENSQWIVHPVDYITNLGDHTFSGGGTDPIIIINAPNGGETWYLDQTYTINWGSANVTGNVKIELSNNGTLSTLAANVPNSGSWTWTITSTVPLGTQYKVKVSTLDGSVFDMSDNFFAIGEITTVNVANIAALRAGNADGVTNYHITGEVFLTYQQIYRNKKYIQDDSGAVEIDDLGGIITTPYQIGDGITGFTCTLLSYHNLLQATPVADPGNPTSTGHVFNPPVVNISELNTNFEAYESELVLLNNVQFEDTSAPFATGTNYNIADPTGTTVFRTSFYDADYIGQAIPTGVISMKVICAQYDTAYQVTSRTSEDFGPVANDENTNTTAPIALLSTYPNPAQNSNNLSFSLKNAAPVTVAIYNNKGQIVRNMGLKPYTAGEHHLVWDARDDNGNAVASGIYFFKLSSGKFSSSKKMIIMR